jgi:hypothetical protein
MRLAILPSIAASSSSPSGRASCMPSSWRASRSPTRTRWVTYWVMCPLSCWSLWCSGSCCHPNKRAQSQHKTPTETALLSGEARADDCDRCWGMLSSQSVPIVFARRRADRGLGRAHVSARSGRHRSDDAAWWPRRANERSSPPTGWRAARHPLSARMRFAATAINGLSSTSPR